MKKIELKNIKKKFGNKTILDGINYEFISGEITAITGKSGSGKSTLLNIIGLLEKPDDGSVTYDTYGEVEANKCKTTLLLRNEISYLFQNYALIDYKDVQSNLEIALEYQHIKKAEKIQILENALREVGLDTSYLHQKVHALSGGEQQRVAMARALLKPCTLLLADEPTGNLDTMNKFEIFQLLKSQAKQGKIVIIVTHDTELANQCNHILTLD